MKTYIKKTMWFLLLFIVFFIIIAVVFSQHPLFGKAPHGERLDKIEQSKNYANGQFQNLSHTPSFTKGVTYWTVLKEMFFTKVPFTKPIDSIPSVKTDLHKLVEHDDIMVWFGHSSYFIKTSGKNFLIDPVLTKNASPIINTNNAFKGADIYSYEDIPSIDYLIITHDHYDHLDYTTFKNIKDKVKLIICPLGVGSHLEYWKYPSNQIIELDWWESHDLTNEIKITSTPTRHFSGRSIKRNNTLWSGYVLKSASLNLYIGGDSGYDSHFKTIGDKFGPFDIAMLENGQYDYKWKYIHTLPEEVVQASKDLQADTFFPIHNSKFKLANHSWKEPLDKIYEIASKDLTLKIIHPKIGEIIDLKNKQQSFDKWWEEIN